jgi:diguanylate cyclase (GGDEF)-like protein
VLVDRVLVPVVSAETWQPMTLVERAFEHAPYGLVALNDGNTLQRPNARARALADAELVRSFLQRTRDRATEEGEPGGRLPGLQEEVVRVSAGEEGEERVLSVALSTAPGATVVGMIDVTATASTLGDLARLAYHDPLTGVANRTLLHERIDQALRRRERSGAEVSLLFLDLDGFKRVNDDLGHAAGDELLVGLAARLQRMVRPADTVARLGGDEFVVLCEGLDRGAVDQLVVRVSAAVAEPFALGPAGVEVEVGASIGTAFTQEGDDSAAALLRRADRAMYEVKGRVVPRGSRGPGPVVDAAQLRRAIDAGEIFVLFQPAVGLQDGEVVSMEALVRWAHPDHGVLRPSQFLDVATASGLMGALGARVLDLACAEASRWADAAEQAGRRPPTLTVNIAAAELADPELPGRVAAALAASGLDPTRLSLELDREACDRPGAVADLRALHDLGVRVSVDADQGGVGDAALLDLPVEEVKLGRSWARRLVRSETAVRVMLSAFTAAARANGIRLTVEGVETGDEVAALAGCGVEAAQGHWFATPQTAEGSARVLGPGMRFRTG